jgi:hypothetical protein
MSGVLGREMWVEGEEVGEGCLVVLKNCVKCNKGRRAELNTGCAGLDM